jgi:hypothetical protein
VSASGFSRATRAVRASLELRFGAAQIVESTRLLDFGANHHAPSTLDERIVRHSMRASPNMFYRHAV